MESVRVTLERVVELPEKEENQEERQSQLSLVASLVSTWCGKRWRNPKRRPALLFLQLFKNTTDTPSAMRVSAVTRDEMLQEVEHLKRDLKAFDESRDAIQRRILELEGDPRRHDLFVSWPAVQAVLNVQIMGIVRCEGLIEDYLRILRDMEVPNNVVELVREKDDVNGIGS